jgi:hypothetical protein
MNARKKTEKDDFPGLFTSMVGFIELSHLSVFLFTYMAFTNFRGILLSKYSPWGKVFSMLKQEGLEFIPALGFSNI